MLFSDDSMQREEAVQRRATSHAIVLAAAAAIFTIHIPVYGGNDERSADNEDIAVDLGVMSVEGRKQELALRMVKLAFERSPSNRAEDLDKVVCWVDKKKGSHMNHLFCGTNRARFRMGRAGQASFNELIRTFRPKAGGPKEPMVAPPSTNNMIFMSDQPVTEGQMEAMSKRLGPSSLNYEILKRAAKGHPMPDDLPNQTELDAFLEAFTSVREIRRDFDPRINDAPPADRRRLQEDADQRMIAAIKDAGLTVERYNRISDLTGRYESLRGYLHQQLAAMGEGEN